MNFGQSDKIKFQQNVVNPKEKWAMQGRVRARHEMLNGLLIGELGAPLPGLLPPHLASRRCAPGVRGGDAAHRREFVISYCSK